MSRALTVKTLAICGCAVLVFLTSDTTCRCSTVSQIRTVKNGALPVRYET
jgi:hypothetical protein